MSSTCSRPGDTTSSGCRVLWAWTWSASDDPNGGTTMLKKVVYVALLVSDQDEALDFYTNVVGLEKRGDYPTPDGPRFLTVGVEGQDFELVLWPGTPARAKLGSAVYTIEVENCRMAFETLKSRGVEFEPPEVLRSEEHTSELQSRQYLVCRLLLE